MPIWVIVNIYLYKVVKRLLVNNVMKKNRNSYKVNDWPIQLDKLVTVYTQMPFMWIRNTTPCLWLSNVLSQKKIKSPRRMFER